jgi:hypothetical protein
MSGASRRARQPPSPPIGDSTEPLRGELIT